MAPESPPAAAADVPGAVRALGRRVRSAARTVARASTDQKNDALLGAAQLLGERAPEILEANAADVEAAARAGLEGTPLDRLRLDGGRLDAMAHGLRAVAERPDPVGEVLDGARRPNGLVIERVRVPLGVVAIIYENRPNVTSDAAALCLKAGNGVILRGSASALRSNVAIADTLRVAMTKAGLPEDAIALVEHPGHEAAVAVMQLTETVDCLIPRGGPSLIDTVRTHATVPVIIDGDGNCHVYVDESADPAQTRAVAVNAKVQRPSVCNAAESLVVHGAVADELLPALVDDLVAQGVELVGDARARRIDERIATATEDDFGREFLDLKMSVAVVDSLDDAIAHVNGFGSGHTESILTTSLDAARRFTAEVDAAAVMVNASTRFCDGEEFGFGAEIGISTQKLHARGPMGLRELTTAKYVVWGDGQVRT